MASADQHELYHCSVDFSGERWPGSQQLSRRICGHREWTLHCLQRADLVTSLPHHQSALLICQGPGFTLHSLVHLSIHSMYFLQAGPCSGPEFRLSESQLDCGDPLRFLQPYELGGASLS